jgi:hypothetical protein
VHRFGSEAEVDWYARPAALTPRRFCHKKRVRQKSNLSWPLKPIWAVQSLREKFFAVTVGQITNAIIAHPSIDGGSALTLLAMR